jgi:hypothetical protein
MELKRGENVLASVSLSISLYICLHPLAKDMDYNNKVMDPLIKYFLEQSNIVLERQSMIV